MIFAIPFYYRSTYLNKVTKNVYSINYQVNQYMITCIVGEIKFIFKHLTLVSTSDNGKTTSFNLFLCNRTQLI